MAEGGGSGQEQEGPKLEPKFDVARGIEGGVPIPKITPEAEEIADQAGAHKGDLRTVLGRKPGEATPPPAPAGPTTTGTGR